jgi:hypothetical protein
MVYRVEMSIQEGRSYTDDFDNLSAVSWTDTRDTKHPEAQFTLRIMSSMEATSHLLTSDGHIPGEKNVWAFCFYMNGTPEPAWDNCE